MNLYNNADNNINYSTLIKRLDSGMDISTALTKPVDKRFRNSKYDKLAEQLKEGILNDWQRDPETSQEKEIIYF